MQGGFRVPHGSKAHVGGRQSGGVGPFDVVGTYEVEESDVGEGHHDCLIGCHIAQLQGHDLRVSE